MHWCISPVLVCLSSVTSHARPSTGGTARWRLGYCSQSVSPRVRRPTGVSPPHQEQDHLGFIVEKSPAFEIIVNSSFHLVSLAGLFLFCFFVWLLGLSFKSAIMSRTPEDVSKLTESTYKVREVHDFVCWHFNFLKKGNFVVIIVISINSSK